LLFEKQVVGGGELLNTSVGMVLGGRYRVDGTLGTGGMAVVYKAEDAILGRCVALKTLRRRYAEEPSFRSRFKQEARVMASLDHENVVKVYDISQEGEVPFIVAECVSGRDVGDMLKSAPKGCLSEQSTKEIAAQLLEALAYAHLHGVIHRDVKPSNILLTEEGIIKVADFGIARVIEEEEAGEPGEVIGSARYMSPEQLRGKETTPRSDLYSVGILLYHCLTGRPPFSGDAKNVARQQIYRDPTSPRKLNKAISPRLEAVILRALAKDPKDRYPSASAMLEDLRRDEIETPETAGLRRNRAHRRRARRRRGGRKTLLVSSVLALLLFIGGGTAAGLGYIGGLEDPPLPSLAEGTLTPTQPVAKAPPEAPADVTQEEPEQSVGSLQEEEPERSTESLQQVSPVLAKSEEPESPQSAAAAAPVPGVNAYFDYFAVETLQNSGFRPQVVYEYHEGYAPKGVVWGTDPVVDTMVPLGSTITVYATPKDQPQNEQPQVQPQPLNQPQLQPPIQAQLLNQPQVQPPIQPQPLNQPLIQPQPLNQPQIRPPIVG
jgi:serine/threonine protein kinase